MIIGVPKEIKHLEARVALLPVGVESLVTRGHEVLIEKSAGLASGFVDSEYEAYGATIVASMEEIYSRSDMIVKVKEPKPEEYSMIREGQIVFTYFHFASSQELTINIRETKCLAIAYETVKDENGLLPLLTPMSEVAGRMAIQQGAHFIQSEYGGRGILLGGVTGVEPATVVVIGGGVVGTNAAQMAAGLGAKTYILDINPNRLRHLGEIMPANVIPLMSDAHTIRKLVRDADVVVNGILIPGAKAPKIIRQKTLKTMRKGSVIIDVAIDQGGGLETSRPTQHDDPIYIEEDVIHYCVTNMPGAVPVTSTVALTNVTLPYILKLADKGPQALLENLGLNSGANIIHGHVTHQGVANAFDLKYVPLRKALGAVA